MKNYHVAADSKRFSSADGVLFSKDQKNLYAYPPEHGEHYDIPDGTVKIGDYAFYGSDINSVTIPDSVTHIGDSAFAGCYDLSRLLIPDSVTYVDYYAFGFSPDVIIYCSRDSYAWKYCEENDIRHLDSKYFPD